MRNRAIDLRLAFFNTYLYFCNALGYYRELAQQAVEASACRSVRNSLSTRFYVYCRLALFNYAAAYGGDELLAQGATVPPGPYSLD